MVLPRTLREIVSSPAVENDTQVSAEKQFLGKRVYRTGETNPDTLRARHRAQGQVSSQGPGGPQGSAEEDVRIEHPEAA